MVLAILPILQYPDPRLREKGKPVKEFDAQIKKVIDDLIETLYAGKNCVGLAAIQVGIPFQITVIDISKERNQLLVLVNPETSNPRGEAVGPEGCMSVGAGLSISGRVKRPATVDVKALDREGNPISFEADGFLATAIQHEVDHLNGILFLDHLPPLIRKMLERKIRKKMGKLKKQSGNPSPGMRP